MMRRGSISNAAGTRFVSEQGTRMGRRRLLHVDIQGENGTDGIYIGGQVTPIIEAVMTLNARLRHGAGVQFWNPDLVQEKLLVTSVKTPLAGRVLAKSEMRNRLPER